MNSRPIVTHQIVQRWSQWTTLADNLREIRITLPGPPMPKADRDETAPRTPVIRKAVKRRPLVGAAAKAEAMRRVAWVKEALAEQIGGEE